MKWTKEEQIATLKIMIEDGGGCNRLNCAPCYFALFNKHKVKSCHDEVAKLRKGGEHTNLLETRLRIAKERLAELTCGLAVIDEEIIILDQNS